jgi:hypothetical protein
MFVDPLGEVGLGIHHALPNRALPRELKVLLLALTWVQKSTYRHNNFDHLHDVASRL